MSKLVCRSSPAIVPAAFGFLQRVLTEKADEEEEGKETARHAAIRTLSHIARHLNPVGERAEAQEMLISVLLHAFIERGTKFKVVIWVKLMRVVSVVDAKQACAGR